MIKKIIAYQKVLLCSVTPADILDNQLLSARRTFFLFVFAVCIALGPLISLSMVNLSIPVVSVFIVYRILNGKIRLFEQVPVSRSFTAANILLFSLLLMLAVYVGILALLLLMLAAVLVLALFFGSVKSGGPSEINPAIAAGEWKNVVFTLLVYLLIISVITAFSYIGNKKLRITGIGLFSASLYVLLWGIKLSMPKVPLSVPQLNGIDIMPYFSLNPHAESILIILGIVCAVLIPGSILFGFKIYTHHQ